MSEFTETKAQSLIDTKSIIRIDANTFQVKSSTPGKSYVIENGICECLGFRYKKQCSHSVAAKILQAQSE
jgi:hypothetical protein